MRSARSGFKYFHVFKFIDTSCGRPKCCRTVFRDLSDFVGRTAAARITSPRPYPRKIRLTADVVVLSVRLLYDAHANMQLADERICAVTPHVEFVLRPVSSRFKQQKNRCLTARERVSVETFNKFPKSTADGRFEGLGKYVRSFESSALASPMGHADGPHASGMR